MLEKFDEEKEDASVKDLQHHLKEKDFEERNSSMMEQMKMLKNSKGTIKDLKRKLVKERGLRRESEAKIKRINERLVNVLQQYMCSCSA